MPSDKLHSNSKIKKTSLILEMRPSNVVNISEDWDLRRREGKVISPSLAFFLMEKKSNIHLSQLPKASRSKNSNLFKFDCRTLFSSGPSIQVDGF